MKYFNSEPKEKPIYQSIEFITMNDFNSEPKWFAIASLYPARVVEPDSTGESMVPKPALEKREGYWKSN